MHVPDRAEADRLTKRGPGTLYVLGTQIYGQAAEIAVTQTKLVATAMRSARRTVVGRAVAERDARRTDSKGGTEAWSARRASRNSFSS